jgi:hypothetical protein
MSYDFNADDVFEMAEQIERNGAVFYRKAAADVTGSGRQNIFYRTWRSWKTITKKPLPP